MFNFELHAGAFETEEETAELQKELNELGIEGTEVSDFNEIKDSIARSQKIREEMEKSNMDGIDTYKELKKEGLIDESTKVIALTANAISGAEEMYISNGFDGYLTKPIDIASLDICLKNNLPADIIEEI